MAHEGHCNVGDANDRHPARKHFISKERLKPQLSSARRGSKDLLKHSQMLAPRKCSPLFLALLPLIACAQPLPDWLALRPSSSPSAYDLIKISDGAAFESLIGTIVLARGEVPFTDAMRCLPGYCVFATQTGKNSAVYSVSNTNATILYRTPCPGTCAHMHFSIGTRTPYTLSQQPSGVSQVLEVLPTGVRLVGDVSDAIGAGAVAPGQTTHCSATDHMYVGVVRGGAGKDAILAVSLTTGAVDNTTTLNVPLYSALWAACDGSTTRVFGGISLTPASTPGANATLAFGHVSATGMYSEDVSVSVPPNFVPNGMLTATSDRSTGNDFAATLYPPTYAADDATATGYLWVVDAWGTETVADELSEFAYNLIAASWARNNW